MAKDQTEVGITGKPVPKPTTAKKQYELEKKRRMEKHLGKNVGGVQYRSDVTPYYNPRARTFKEFLEIAEAKVEAGMSDIAKKDIRSRRFVGAEKQKDYDAMGPTAANWVSAARLRAHRKRDELNKDAKDIRRGKLDKPQFQGKTGQERVAIVKKAKGMK